MRQKLNLYGDTMALSLVLWVCSLPLIGLVIPPLFGWARAAYLALGLLVVLLIVCWGICVWRAAQKQDVRAAPYA
jgi:hypothetical protein